MKVHENYIKQLAMSTTVFDMAAICYSILEREISNPILFISQYADEVSENDSRSINENRHLLRAFSDNIAKLLEPYSESNFNYIRSIITAKIREINLKPFLESNENQLSVIFTLLSTIDSLVSLWNIESLVGHSALNEAGICKSYFVYLAAPDSLLRGLIENINRERKSEGNFQETLRNLIFIKKDSLPRNAEIPAIRFLKRKNIHDIHHIKVAVITGFTGCHFHFPYTVGSTVIVEYVKTTHENPDQLRIAEQICNKMKTAIKQGAEFILLPEFCISQEILEYIKKKLCEWKKDNTLSSNLVAVFPGSTWTASNNNVQFILDDWGREVGNYYKNTPYRKKQANGRGYECCEGLANPGLNTCLLWVDGLGYILPATCRDVIDSEYTRLLVQKFHPAFLMVPAWSSSGSSFMQPLKEYAADYFTNSVLCNGCGALKGRATIVGGVSIVGKRGTVAAGCFQPIEKPVPQKQICSKSCQQYCSHLFNIDFSAQNSGFTDRVYVDKL